MCQYSPGCIAIPSSSLQYFSWFWKTWRMMQVETKEYNLLPCSTNPEKAFWVYSSSLLFHSFFKFFILFIFFFVFFILQVLIRHQFYTHQCIHVNPNSPIQHNTIPTPPQYSPLGVHMSVLYICVSTSALHISSSVPFF